MGLEAHLNDDVIVMRRDEGSPDPVISAAREDLGFAVQSRAATRRPSMYKVLLLNDDYTPMDFVVHILETFFNKSQDEATNIMLTIHRQGIGVAGIFTFEVAETKVTQVTELARSHQHPLQCAVERA